MDTNELKKIASQVRRDIIRQTNAANSGHPGGSLGCTELLVALYFKIMKHSPAPFSMDGKNEDMFFLSNGHISPLWYSVLARSGYFDIEELSTFRKINSRLQGHPATHEGLPGVRVASGSLGQGLSVAIGAAESKKLNGDKRIVFCLCGDGEMEEGQIWEAVMYAGARKVNNLIAIIDVNNQQIDGSIEQVMPYGDLRPKFESFGWNVLEMDGNDMQDVVQTLETALASTGAAQPVVIMMKTVMGQGVDFMMHTHKWHGVAPNDEQTKIALAQLEETLGDY
ncbi:MAG: transketolase [Bacteroidetes bacterium]|nr:MAG: transketolase [Bacteroidota bacterium]REJ99955.1 MAG: transketolase [Bacteroidota bacterium]REK35865.1 MAG: transketolase [Bacteroidota bacterium]REK50658.1 MAG: transketolase [Bacteroidota bacterium]